MPRVPTPAGASTCGSSSSAVAPREQLGAHRALLRRAFGGAFQYLECALELRARLPPPRPRRSRRSRVRGANAGSRSAAPAHRASQPRRRPRTAAIVCSSDMASSCSVERAALGQNDDTLDGALEHVLRPAPGIALIVDEALHQPEHAQLAFGCRRDDLAEQRRDVAGSRARSGSGPSPPPDAVPTCMRRNSLMITCCPDDDRAVGLLGLRAAHLGVRCQAHAGEAHGRGELQLTREQWRCVHRSAAARAGGGAKRRAQRHRSATRRAQPRRTRASASCCGSAAVTVVLRDEAERQQIALAYRGAVCTSSSVSNTGGSTPAASRPRRSPPARCARPCRRTSAAWAGRPAVPRARAPTRRRAASSSSSELRSTKRMKFGQRSPAAGMCQVGICAALARARTNRSHTAAASADTAAGQWAGTPRRRASPPARARRTRLDRAPPPGPSATTLATHRMVSCRPPSSPYSRR